MLIVPTICLVLVYCLSFAKYSILHWTAPIYMLSLSLFILLYNHVLKEVEITSYSTQMEIAYLVIAHLTCCVLFQTSFMVQTPIRIFGFLTIDVLINLKAATQSD